ncbi:MAG: hypothetical protein IJQ02_16190 [Oscillospiraceae bacterium]|nr:hypothetical protein [Oscillospiraceae bacterium]
MATIALYSGKINQMPSLVRELRSGVSSYSQSLAELQRKSLSIDRNVCDLDDVINELRVSSRTQEERVDALDRFQEHSEEFIDETIRIDNDVAETVDQTKDDFYEKYDYLKPDCEKSGWEHFCDGLEAFGDWCKEHWKQIVITVVIVVGAVLAIAAVVCSGGVALAPMLAAGLTALGMASGTAMTVATVASLVVAGIAITSTLASSALNLVDLWCDMSGNSTFQAWKTAMNWTSMISNGFYSVGSMFNAAHGITNTALRDYSKQFLTNSDFRAAIQGADQYANLGRNLTSSEFWSGLGSDGGRISEEYAREHGMKTLGMLMDENGVAQPAAYEGWRAPSAYMAMNSGGDATMLFSNVPGAGSVWNTTERILLGVNPNITSITFTQLGVGSQFVPRVFQFGSLFGGLASGGESVLSWFRLSD